MPNINGKSHESDLTNQKSRTTSTPKPASLKLITESEGDTSWFHQTQVFNDEPNEGDSLNQKLKTARALKSVSRKLRIASRTAKGN
jgi:hypothetical protein